MSRGISPRRFVSVILGIISGGGMRSAISVGIGAILVHRGQAVRSVRMGFRGI
jgi:hypothetical protein